MSYKQRLVGVVLFGILLVATLDWLTFHRTAITPLFGSKLLVIVVLALCLAAIYPLYLIARKSNRTYIWSSIGMIGLEVCVFVALLGRFVLHLSDSWTGLALDIGRVSAILGVLISVTLLLLRRNKEEKASLADPNRK
jgi:hypothetical protein